MGRCETLHCQLRVEIRTVREELVMLKCESFLSDQCSTAGHCRLLQDQTDERDDGEEETEGSEEVQPGDRVDTCEEYCNNEVTRVGEERDHLAGHLPSVLSCS